jgi:hypothetical protein
VSPGAPGSVTNGSPNWRYGWILSVTWADAADRAIPGRSLSLPRNICDGFACAFLPCGVVDRRAMPPPFGSATDNAFCPADASRELFISSPRAFG